MHISDQPQPYAYYRKVEETDLPSVAWWYCEMAGFSPIQYPVMLDVYFHQYRDLREIWRDNTLVYVLRGRPVFLLEMTTGPVVYLTAPSTIWENVRRLSLVWQASLVHLFIRCDFSVVFINVEVSRSLMIQALERIGCKRESMYRDHQGTFFRYVCRPADLRMVI